MGWGGGGQIIHDVMGKVVICNITPSNIFLHTYVLPNILYHGPHTHPHTSSHTLTHTLTHTPSHTHPSHAHPHTHTLTHTLTLTPSHTPSHTLTLPHCTLLAVVAYKQLLCHVFGNIHWLTAHITLKGIEAIDKG